MRPDPGWASECRTSQGRTLVLLSGEIDLVGSGRLQEILQEAVRAAAFVTVDLSAVGFIDSTVIGALVSARNTAQARGCRLTVVNAADQVRRVLEMTGVLDALSA